MELKEKGQEWCPQCKVYHRYKSHGFINPEDDLKECPKVEDMDARYFILTGKLRIE